MTDQFDPNQAAQNLTEEAERQAKEKANEAIDQSASRIPGGDQVAQQAKDTMSQGIEGGAQRAEDVAKEQLGGLTDKFGGGASNNP